MSIVLTDLVTCYGGEASPALVGVPLLCPAAPSGSVGRDLGANAVAAVLAALSFVIFFFRLRHAARRTS